MQWGLISLEYSCSELGGAKPKVLSVCPFFSSGACARECGWELVLRLWEHRKVRQLGPDICSPSGRLSQLAHAIRLLLEYTDSNYEEKKYTMGDGNDIFVMS